MGKVSIPYSSLSDASREAEAVASKINTRETILYKNVYLKLNSYDGRWSDNLGNAKSKVNAKEVSCKEKSGGTEIMQMI